MKSVGILGVNYFTWPQLIDLISKVIMAYKLLIPAYSILIASSKIQNTLINRVRRGLMKFIERFIVGCLVLAGSTANAALVTLNGDDVSFTFDDATLYGAGNVVGNTIFFFPTSFRAESTNGSPSIDAINETLSIRVDAITQGFSMSTMMISEDGDYRVDGAGASVTANGFFRATSLTTLCGFPPCQDEVLFNAGALPPTGTGIDQWSMGGSINLGDTLGWGSDTSLNLTIENNLSATTLASGEIAWIEKKFSVTVPGVPVPPAVWLFASGLVGLAGIARRKRI